MTPTMFDRSANLSHLATPPTFSPLILADRLISLAQEADLAGMHDSASRLLGLVYAVLDDGSVPLSAL